MTSVSQKRHDVWWGSACSFLVWKADPAFVQAVMLNALELSAVKVQNETWFFSIS